MTELDSVSNKFGFLQLIIVIFIVLLIIYQVNISIQGNASIPDSAKLVMAKASTKAPTTFDYVALVGYLGLIVVSCVAALRKNSYPFILPVMIGVIILTTLTSILLKYYVIDNLFLNETFALIMANCPIITYLLNNIIMFSIIYAILVGVCLNINIEQFGGGSQW